MIGATRARPARKGFAADADGARWTFAGALTFANAGAVLDGGAARCRCRRRGVVDLAGIGAVDSAARRGAARAEAARGRGGRPLAFVDVPAALAALADLYGVEELLAA